MRRKLEENAGMALITILLLAGVITLTLMILWSGYQQHVRDRNRTFDRDQVREAEALARHNYLSEARSGGVTYCYDGIHHRMVPPDRAGRIRGYGRTAGADNRHQETGARGIPNRGGRNGAQFLAVSVEEDGTVSAYWRGKTLTVYDYNHMTGGERKRLTLSQYREIRLDRQRLANQRKQPESEGK
ncbi:hypothetical protein [Eubacterium pyruvativorans]|nr:hypothetical protein [Eubacterium pyruvativorans]MCI5746928.1 hypothetical protein [Eubacterium pyruvativorans]